MEKKVLYLEIDEEITSVVDKLRKTAEEEIFLVVPKEAALLQSIVNLKLLKKQASNLKKKVRVITHDKVGRNLAEQVGIDASSRINEFEEPAAKEEEISGDVVSEPSSVIKMKEKAPVTDDSPLEKTDEVVFAKESIEKEKPKKDTGDPNLGDEEPEKANTKDLIPRFPFKKVGLIVLVLFVILLGFSYWYVPMTRISLTLAAEKKDMKTNFTVDKAAKEMSSSSQTIPGTVISFEKEINKSYQATGKKNVGTKATGKIRVSNLYSTVSQTLVGGTRFQANGLVFRSVGDVDVPGYVDNGGNPSAGTVEVTVTADAAGDQYNLAPTTFTIPGFSGTTKFEKITGSSSAAFTGGTTKEVSVVTQDDVNKAKESFSEEAKQEAIKGGEERKKEGETVDEKAQKTEVIGITISENVGDEATRFQVSGKGKFTGLAYKNDDLKKLVFELFKSSVPPGKQILENNLEGIDMKIAEVDLEKGVMTAEGTATVHIGTKINEGDLKNQISGLNSRKLNDYLENLEGVEGTKVEFWPSFIKSTSRVKSHIYVKTEFAEK